MAKHYKNQMLMLVLMSTIFSTKVYAENSKTAPDAPPTVNAFYVKPSISKKLNPGEKMAHSLEEILQAPIYCNA